VEGSDFDCKFFLVVVGCKEVEMEEYRLRGVLRKHKGRRREMVAGLARLNVDGKKEENKWCEWKTRIGWG
jgi:hypothetical protein